MTQVSGHTRADVRAAPAVLDRVLSGADGEWVVSFLVDRVEPAPAAGLAALAAEGSPFAHLDAVRRLVSVRVARDEVVAPALEHAARQHLGAADDVAGLVRRAVACGRDFVAAVGAAAPADDVARWDDFAPAYLRAMSPRPGALHARLGRRRRG